MVERAIVLTVAAVTVAATVLVVRWWSRRGVAGLRAAPAEGLWTALGATPDGRPSLVVFSTPSCTVCRTAQYPAIETVEATYGSALRILRVDLSRQPAAAAGSTSSRGAAAGRPSFSRTQTHSVRTSASRVPSATRRMVVRLTPRAP